MPTFLNLTIQREGKIPLTEAILGSVQIRSSTVKCSNFGKFQISFKFPFFCVQTPDNLIFIEFSAFEHFCEVGYDDDATKQKKIDTFTVSNHRFLGGPIS